MDLDDLTADQRMELARLEAERRTRRDVARWSAIKAVGVAFVGGAAVGLTTAAVNYEIQSTELAIEKERTQRELSLREEQFAAEDRDARRQLEQDYLARFLEDALSEDLQRRIDFAQYVASVTLNDGMRDLWERYHAALEEELTDTRRDLREKVVLLEEERQADDERGAARVEALEQEIEQLRRRVDAPAKSPRIVIEMPPVPDSNCRSGLRRRTRSTEGVIAVGDCVR